MKTMKRAKGCKVASPEPADESPRGNAQKHARISDLNKSKYLSPCRSVGLTRKRKIFSSSNGINSNEHKKITNDNKKSSTENKKIEEKERNQDKENVTSEIKDVPEEDATQNSGEVLSEAFGVVTVQSDQPIVKLTHDSSVTRIENSLKKTKSVTRIKRTDSEEDIPLSKVAKIERSKTRVSIKSKSVKSASKRTRSLVTLPVCTVAANGDDDDDDFINTKTIVDRKTYNKWKPGEEELEVLIKRWRKGCQAALDELLNITREKIAGNENVDMEALLLKLNIPVELVKYNLETSSFE